MRAALFNPITILLACLCIHWIALASVGPFSIKLPYAVVGLVVVYALTSSRRLAGCVLFVRQNIAWIAPFAAYLLLLTAVLYGTAGANLAPRQIFYLLGCIALAGCLAVAPNRASILRVGAALAIVVFVLVVEILAQSIGLSWIDAIGAFLTSGDLHFVIYKFFREVFRTFDPSDDLSAVATYKNGIAVCVLAAGLMYRSASAKPSRDIAGVFLMGVVLFLLLLLNSQSVIIVACMSLLLAIAVSAARHREELPKLLLKFAAALAIAVLAVGYTNPETAAADAVGERFAFDDESTTERVVQQQVALERIRQHPITGSGYFEIEGRSIHNLFLSAWMHAGLAAFLLVTAFYTALVVRWLTFLWTITRNPDRWVLPIAVEWIAPLPILPLFRVWLSGSAGHLFLGEWVALAAFLGIVLANDLKLRSATAQRAARAAPRPIAPASAGSAA